MPEATLKLPPRVPKSVIVRPADSGCLNVGSEDGNPPPAPIPLQYPVPAGPNSSHAKTLPGVPESRGASATSGREGSNPPSHSARLRIRNEVPNPVRATEPRGAGPVTATAAANVPITISPTPTNANRRLTAIAPAPPESTKERESRIDAFMDKAIIPQQRASARIQGGIYVWAVRRKSREAYAREKDAPDGEFGSRPSLPTGPP